MSCKINRLQTCGHMKLHWESVFNDHRVILTCSVWVIMDTKCCKQTNDKICSLGDDKRYEIWKKHNKVHDSFTDFYIYDFHLRWIKA